jgi:hypothetical protein
MRRNVIKMMRMKKKMIVTEVAVTETVKRAFSPKPRSRISFRRSRKFVLLSIPHFFAFISCENVEWKLVNQS